MEKFAKLLVNYHKIYTYCLLSSCAGTKAVFNLLFAQPTEFDLKTSKVMQAEKKGVSRARVVL